MSRKPTLLLLAILLGLMPACRDRGQSDDGHGHTHEASGGHSQAVPAGERPTVAVTHWTDRTELFMEYPVFVAGESGRAAIHITDLIDFSPLSEGEAIVVLRADEGRVLLEFRDGPSSPGFFGVDLKVAQPGVYDMSLRVEAPGLQDLHQLGPLTVHPPGDRLPADEQEDEAISFLKEQQWTLEFGTESVAERAIRRGFAVPGTIRPRSGGDALLTAPVPGRVDPGAAVPVRGTRVRSGTVLARIVPRSEDLSDGAGLRAALVEAEQAHLLAVQDRDRAKRLFEARAVPERRLDEATAAAVASEARLDAARERFDRFEALTGKGASSAVFTLRAPFDGVVSEVRYTAGESVEANEPLLRVVDPEHVDVVGAVPEASAANLGGVASAELELGRGPTLSLGEPLAVNPVIDPVARTAEVRFALDNRDLRLRIGQAVRLRLLVGEETSGVAIPESAIVDDGGRPVVFVQTGGESFERRPVQLGSAAAGYVHVLAGVEPGERVVHRGAYLVRLSAMSTQVPAHGHVH